MEWFKNYYRTRKAANVAFRALYRLNVEGEPFGIGPVLLMPAHQTNADGSSLMNAIEGPLAFVYSYRMGFHFPIISPWFRDILYNIGGIEVRKRHFDFERFFSNLANRIPIVAFPNECQPGAIGSFKTGIATLVSRYEESHKEQVAFVPVGIEYRTLKHFGMPASFFHFPPPGTVITVRFGNPLYLAGTGPEKLTELVMRENAKLSKVPYFG